MTKQQTEALDLLGRKIGIGDHVVWQMGQGLGHGFVTAVECHHNEWWVTATRAPGSRKRGQKARAKEFCGIVLPDIQDPEIQLAEEPTARSDAKLLGYL